MSSKTIAKNTIMLYTRQILILLVSLYTVRVVLEVLGVEDYGIYNVVGGVVTMFSFLSATMASASQRYFSFELGRKNYEQLKKTFSMTMTIYAMIALLIFLLTETIGLWFLNTKMTIPEERMAAANWVYQFSILTLMMTMFTVPYNAAIIAHERMGVYAWVSIVEAFLKLLIVYLLVLISFDKLKLYAILMFSVTTIVTFIYRMYCQRKFDECRFQFYWNKELFIEIITFSGWNLWGAMASVFKNQGINILLNLFFNPAINAARGVASQVNVSMNLFVQNFMTATRPQITKYYAAGKRTLMNNLVFQSAKFSYFLLFFLSMPVLLETNFVLTIWLKEVPEYVVLFTRLVIINALIDTISRPLITSLLATGKIKKYQVVVGGITLLNIPVSYIFLKFGFPPETTLYIAICIAAVNLVLRLFFLRRITEFPVRSFTIKVILRVVMATIVAYVIPFGILAQMEESWLRFITISTTGVLTTILSIYLIGLSKGDQSMLMDLVRNKITSKFPLKRITKT